ncbi:MAG: hypothetical protein O2955_19065 [Planctomycetota bacterium]|nr:hypothetical protein [Planctomycetota bacterium]MDA1214617.1 hypothetical protein [Planctomycetota bacterium]
MSNYRVMTLLFGPVVLVACSYVATWSLFASPTSQESDGIDDTVDTEKIVFDDATLGAETADVNHPLASDMLQTARALRMRLDDDRYRILVRAPFVLAGDLSAQQLDEYYRETIVPTQRALNTQFFDRLPKHPISVLLLHDDDSYREVSHAFDGLHRDCYAGYYIRDERRIVVNVSTGNGTLAHELAHALAHADHEDLPEWFDEGFASLFEQSEFSEDGLQLLGLTNWRIHYLAPALNRDRLPPLEQMFSRQAIRSQNEGLDYAMARCFCLFLQERRLLAPFYRKMRQSLPNKSSSKETILDLFGYDDFTAIDAQFTAWLRTTYKAYVKGASSSLESVTRQ